MCVCMCLRAQARNSDSNLGRLGPGPAIQRLAPLDPVREFPDMPRRSRTRPGSTEPGLGSRPRADCFFSHFTCEGELGGIQRVPNPSCPAFPGSPASQRRVAIGFPQATGNRPPLAKGNPIVRHTPKLRPKYIPDTVCKRVVPNAHH